MRKHHRLEGSSLNKKPYIRTHLICLCQFIVVKQVESIYALELLRLDVLYLMIQGKQCFEVRKVSLTYAEINKAHYIRQ